MRPWAPHPQRGCPNPPPTPVGLGGTHCLGVRKMALCAKNRPKIGGNPTSGRLPTQTNPLSPWRGRESSGHIHPPVSPVNQSTLKKSLALTHRVEQRNSGWGLNPGARPRPIHPPLGFGRKKRSSAQKDAQHKFHFLLQTASRISFSTFLLRHGHAFGRSGPKNPEDQGRGLWGRGLVDHPSSRCGRWLRETREEQVSLT